MVARLDHEVVVVNVEWLCRRRTAVYLKSLVAAVRTLRFLDPHAFGNVYVAGLAAVPAPEAYVV